MNTLAMTAGANLKCSSAATNRRSVRTAAEVAWKSNGACRPLIPGSRVHCRSATPRLGRPAACLSAAWAAARMGESAIDSTLGRLAAGENLSMGEMSAAIEAIMQGRCSEGEIGLLLTGLRLKGETAEEVAGAAAAMRRNMTPIRSTREGLMDTCGTGGDGAGTFNISTAAALVTAAAGVHHHSNC